MLLAAAGVLGSVAVANAQPAPEGAPPAPLPPPPVAQPAPIAEPVAPLVVAPPPQADAPPPAVVGSGAPTPSSGADTTTKEPAKKPNPWGFTRFTWSNTGSTKIFGVGKDYIGTEDSQFVMGFGMNIRYVYLNEPKDRAYVNVGFGWDVEMTNSDSTTKERDPLFRDMSVSTGYSHVVYQSEDKETKTSPGLSVGLGLPTSLASRNQGKYFTSNVGALVIHQQKLRGSSADWFQGVLLFGSAGWSHLFSRATQPTNEAANIAQRPRTTCSNGDCAAEGTDALSGGLFTHDTVRLNLTYYLDIYKDLLSFGNTWGYDIPFKYTPPASDCIKISTGCAKPGDLTNPNAGIPLTTFDVSISYAIPSNLGRADFGYTNSAPALGEDGTRRSIFYSPDAQFYVNLVAYFDGIGEKIYDSATKKKTAEIKKQIAELPRYGALFQH
jgi:hypothetical protein